MKLHKRLDCLHRYLSVIMLLLLLFNVTVLLLMWAKIINNNNIIINIIIINKQQTLLLLLIPDSTTPESTSASNTFIIYAYMHFGEVYAYYAKNIIFNNSSRERNYGGRANATQQQQ